MQQYSLSILETLETYSSWDDVWKTGSGNSKREKSIEMNVISCVKRYFDGVANRNIDSIDCQSLPLLFFLPSPKTSSPRLAFFLPIIIPRVNDLVSEQSFWRKLAGRKVEDNRKFFNKFSQTHGSCLDRQLSRFLIKIVWKIGNRLYYKRVERRSIFRDNFYYKKI